MALKKPLVMNGGIVSQLQAGDTLGVGNLTDSGLTAERVPYASTDGLLVDSANLRWDGMLRVVTGIGINSASTSANLSIVATTQLCVDIQQSANASLEFRMINSAVTRYEAFNFGEIYGTKQGVIYYFNSSYSTAGRYRANTLLFECLTAGGELNFSYPSSGSFNLYNLNTIQLTATSAGLVSSSLVTCNSGLVVGGMTQHGILFVGSDSKICTETQYTFTGLEDSIVSVWHFNEGSGTSAADDVGSNDFTLSAETWSTSSKIGQYAARIYASRATILPTNSAWTIMGWVWSDVWDVAGRGILSCGNTNIDGSPSLLVNTDSDGGNLRIFANGAYGSNGAASLTASTWYHIALTYNGTDTYQLYVDGVADASKTVAGHSGNNTTTYLGSGYSSVHHDIKLDEWALFNAVLDASTILEYATKVPKITLEGDTFDVDGNLKSDSIALGNLTSGKIPRATTNGKLIDGQTPLSGTKVYYVSDSSGGSPTRKLTFIDGILTAEL